LSLLIDFFASSLGDEFYKSNFYYFLLISQFAGILFPVILYIKIKKIPYQKELRLGKLKVLHIVLIVIMAPLVMLIASDITLIWNHLLGFSLESLNADIPDPANNNELMLALIVIGLTPAICEEALCRGVLLNGYEKYGSMKAVLLSGMLFSILHLDIRTLAGIFFMGIVIGYYVVRTNSIFAGILAHFLHNAILTIYQYLFKDMMAGPAPQIEKNEIITFLVILILLLSVFILILTGFWAATKKTAEKNYIKNTRKRVMPGFIFHWPVLIIIIIYVLFQIFVVLK
jgi:membrane protease YdiL (CAAX protease family)